MGNPLKQCKHCEPCILARLICDIKAWYEKPRHKLNNKLFTMYQRTKISEQWSLKNAAFVRKVRHQPKMRCLCPSSSRSNKHALVKDKNCTNWILVMSAVTHLLHCAMVLESARTTHDEPLFKQFSWANRKLPSTEVLHEGHIFGSTLFKNNQNESSLLILFKSNKNLLWPMGAKFGRLIFLYALACKETKKA